MKPAPFKYFAPVSLEEALELKNEHGEDAKVLAGGQSLIPAMNFRLAQPAILIDINKLNALRFIEARNGSLHIGAMTLQAQAEESDLVSQKNPLLFETIPNIAHPQIRNRGTIGGSLAHADPASELPVIAYATQARFKAQSIKGERWISVEEFFAGMFYVSLQPNEILVEVEFPDLPKGAGWAFLEVARRKGDYAMAGLAATLTIKDKKISAASLTYLNVGDGPIQGKESVNSLIGKPATEEVFSEAAIIASEKEMAPFGNVHASPEFQQHLSKVLTKRALSTAYSRAEQG